MKLAFDDGHSRVYDLPHAAYAETRGGPCRLRIETGLRQQADCAAPATLIRRELWVAGWRAHINGEKAAIRQIGGMFQSVALPAGNADIVWDYRPPHVQAMAMICALGAAISIGLALHPWLRRLPASRFE